MRRGSTWAGDDAMSGRSVMKPATMLVVLLGMWSWTGCGDECSRSSDCPAGRTCYQGSCRLIGVDADQTAIRRRVLEYFKGVSPAS